MNSVRAVLTCVAGAFCCAHLVYVAIIVPDVAYMDTLRYISNYPDIAANPWRIFEHWEQGQQRGLWSQLIVWGNIRYLKLNILAANLLTAIVLFAICASLISHLDSGNSTRRKAETAALGCVVVLMIFSPAAFELFTLDLGFPELTRNLVFILSLAFFESWMSGRLKSRAWSVAICLVAAFDVLVIGYGRAFPFVASVVVLTGCLVAMRRLGPAGIRRSLFLVSFSMLLLATYVKAGSQPLLGTTANAGFAAKDLQDAVHGILVGVGSLFIGGETARDLGVSWLSIVLLGLCFLFAATIVVTIFVRQSGQDAPAFFPVALIAYGVGCAAAVGIARGGDQWGPAASRYFPDIAIAGAGFILAAVSVLSREHLAIRERHLIRILLVMTSIGLLIGHGATYNREWVAAPSRAAAFDQMRKLTLDGQVRSEGDWKLLQSDEKYARAGLEVQHRLCLGPVRPTCRNR